MRSRSLLVGAFIYLASLVGLHAQQQVTPGYQVPNSGSGSTVYGWQPVDATHGLPTTATIAGGTVSNASSGVAPTSTNIPTVAYGYLWNGTGWDQSTGLLTGTVGAPGSDVVTVQPPIQSGSAGYPTAATPITGNASGTTGAVVGTLAAVANKTTYICGFHIDSTGSGAIGPITLAGIVGSSMVFQGTAGVNNNLSQVFTPCIPASAQNTAITMTTTADGTATAVNVNTWGFQQ